MLCVTEKKTELQIFVRARRRICFGRGQMGRVPRSVIAPLYIERSDEEAMEEKKQRLPELECVPAVDP